MIRPDTYVGSLNYDKQSLYVFNVEKQEIEFREIRYVPGLYKIFGKYSFSVEFADEILVNAADNFQRDQSMS